MTPTPAKTSAPSKTSGLIAEPPSWANTLADSIGINVHVSTYFKSSDFPTVIVRLKSLGVQHVRDGILVSDPPYNAAMTQLLSGANAKLDGLTDCAGIEYYPQSVTSPQAIQNFDAAIGGRLEDVEGPNEVDTRSDENWAADTIACLPGLRSAEPKLPFIAPSIADQYDHATMLGNISPDVDYGNGHRYFAGRDPATTGWGGTNGCGVYGALTWALCEVRINSGKKPIFITETGYNSQTEVNEATQAKYLSRLPFVNLLAGVKRTYIYDLKDYVGGDGFGGNGLIRTDDSPKPSFNAIANDIKLFTDPGNAPALQPLSYSVAGGASLYHMLFEKRDGTYVLALWNEAPSWNPNAKTAVLVSKQLVTITFASAPRSPTAVSMNDSGNLVSAGMSLSNSIITVPVDDHLTFISFKT